MKRFLLTAIMTLAAIAISRGEETANICRGTVVDQKGEPMVGAVVTAKGTTVSVPTDIDGKFSLEVPDNVRKLEITYMGYNVKTVKALPEVGLVKMSRKGLHAGMFGVGASIGISEMYDDDGDYWDYNKDTQNNMLIGVHAQYSTSKRIRFALGMSYGIPDDNVSLFDLGLDMHITISLGKKFYVYPLVGLGFSNVHFGDEWDYDVPNNIGDDYWRNNSGNHDFNHNNSSVSFSIGLGWEYLVSDRVAISLEGRGRIVKDFSETVGLAKVTYFLRN